MTTNASTLDSEQAPGTAQAGPVASPRKKPVRLVAASVMSLAAAGVVGWYALHKGLESTDDAQIEAEVVAVPARAGGLVQNVAFAENQIVKAGELLVELDAAPASARLAQAEAELAAAKASADAAEAEVAVVETTARGQKSVAEASLEGAAVGATTSADEIVQADAAVTAATVARQQAAIDLDRTKQLFAANTLPKQQLDLAQTGLDGAEANLAQARARQAVVRSATAGARAKIVEARARVGQASAVDQQIAQARARAAGTRARVGTAQALRDLASLELSYTKIYAPREGMASRKTVVVGQMLAPGQAIVQVVPIHDVWVTANFKETQLDKMHPGQSAEIDVDAYPGLTLHGEIESLSSATGSRFSLLPAENATGNFTKVVQRVPIRIRIKDLPADKVLRPGMSADVTIDARK